MLIETEVSVAPAAVLVTSLSPSEVENVGEAGEGFCRFIYQVVCLNWCIESASASLGGGGMLAWSSLSNRNRTGVGNIIEY